MNDKGYCMIGSPFVLSPVGVAQHRAPVGRVSKHELWRVKRALREGIQIDVARTEWLSALLRLWHMLFITIPGD